MLPVPSEDFELDPPGGSIWLALRDLALSAVVVCAVALVVGFLTATA